MKKTVSSACRRTIDVNSMTKGRKQYYIKTKFLKNSKANMLILIPARFTQEDKIFVTN